MEEKIKIKSFTDLVAWKEGHKLVISIYNLQNISLKKNCLD
jgi:hypothetical protein